MELSGDQRIELEQHLLKLVESYDKASRASREIGWVYLRVITVGFMINIWLYFELGDYEDSRLSYTYSALLMTTGILLILFGIYSWIKKKQLIKVEKASISNTEKIVKERFHLEYCECDIGQHFFSPEKKKIWNVNQSILFGEHSTERQVPFIWK